MSIGDESNIQKLSYCMVRTKGGYRKKRMALEDGSVPVKAGDTVLAIYALSEVANYECSIDIGLYNDKETGMARGKGIKSGVGGGRGTGKGLGKGGLRTGAKNKTGPRAKSGTCVKK